MITTKLSGGLGNQMFQYAVGRALASRLDTNLALDVTNFSRKIQRSVRTKRTYELGVFALNNSVRLIGVSRIPTICARRPSGRENTLVESTFHFNADVLQATDNSSLIGYWQSERYFVDCAKIVRADFEFQSQPSPESEGLLDIIRGGTSISLHVRRGDYVTDSRAASFHGNLTLNYYQHAVETLAEHYPDAQVFVFSDDIDWCIEHLRLPISTTFVIHNNGRRSFEDLLLMANCKHHILANSSFSWWGAWLAEHPGQQVIAPDPWFAGSSADTRDLLPLRWRTLRLAP
jgi:Glycosyl transferase family 11